MLQLIRAVECIRYAVHVVEEGVAEVDVDTQDRSGVFAVSIYILLRVRCQYISSVVLVTTSCVSSAKAACEVEFL